MPALIRLLLIIFAISCALISCTTITPEVQTVIAKKLPPSSDKINYSWQLIDTKTDETNWQISLLSTNKDGQTYSHWQVSNTLLFNPLACERQLFSIKFNDDISHYRVNTCPVDKDINVYSLQLQILDQAKNSKAIYWQDRGNAVRIPVTEALPNADIYRSAMLVRYIYQMADLHLAEQDHLAAFPSKDYTLITTIFSHQTWLGGIETKQFYGFIAEDINDKDIYLVVRGTVTAIDWLNDVDFFQRQWITPAIPETAGVKVHSGFLDLYQSLSYHSADTDEKELQPLIQRYLEWQQQGKTLHIIGHSLGAAVATIMATDIATQTNDDNLELITLAAPKTGNAAFADQTETIARFNRVTNVQDIITHVPLNLGFNYEHAGKQVPYSALIKPKLQAVLKENEISCWHHIETYLSLLNPDHQILPDRSCWFMSR